MNPVENFIYQHEGEQLKILQHFHHLFAEDFGLTPKIRFKVPFYYHKSWVMYLSPTKEQNVDLSFIRGYELLEFSPLLDLRDRKQIASISLVDFNNIPQEEIMMLVQEAISLEDLVPYSKRPKLKTKKK